MFGGSLHSSLGRIGTAAAYLIRAAGKGRTSASYVGMGVAECWCFVSWRTTSSGSFAETCSGVQREPDEWCKREVLHRRIWRCDPMKSCRPPLLTTFKRDG